MRITCPPGASDFGLVGNPLGVGGEIGTRDLSLGEFLQEALGFAIDGFGECRPVGDVAACHAMIPFAQKQPEVAFRYDLLEPICLGLLMGLVAFIAGISAGVT